MQYKTNKQKQTKITP